MKIHEVIKLALEDNTRVFLHEDIMYTAREILSYPVEDLGLDGWETRTRILSCKQKQVISLLIQAIELWEKACDEEECDRCAFTSEFAKGNVCGILDDLHDTLIDIGFMRP